MIYKDTDVGVQFTIPSFMSSDSKFVQIFEGIFNVPLLSLLNFLLCEMR